MDKKRASIIAFILIGFSFLLGIVLYPVLPETLATHWNAQGEVNGYMAKFWALFLLPSITLITYLILLYIPKLDPLKENIAKFRKPYNSFTVVLVIFLFYIHLLTIYWDLGFRFNMLQLTSPGLGLLFYFIGVLISRSKRNWIIGIRTPWTLSDEKVWDKTHELGGKLFRIAGIICFLGLVFPSYAIWIILVPIILASLSSVVFSYFEYSKRK